MWKKYLLVKKHRKVSFFIFLGRFMSSKFAAGACARTRTYARRAKFDDINLLWKMTKFTFLCFFTNKYFFQIKTKLTVSKSLFSMWRYFFDSMHFRLCPAPSGGFLKKAARQFQFHLTTLRVQINVRVQIIIRGGNFVKNNKRMGPNKRTG